ncbi:MAG: tetratricopeptide repeat protein [Candidatus Edwardsbacteria bacterium]|nr:tetratricopeptide repeat protein [Candidatus Edwardsbacteria bacterium]
MRRFKNQTFMLIVAAVIISLGVVGCNQYISGAKVRLQEDPPNYDAAILTLNEGLEYAPKDPEMHGLLAYCYVQTKKYKEAGKSYASAIEYSSTQKDSLQKAWDDNWNDLFNLSGVYLKKSVSGSKDSAAFNIEKSLEQINFAIDLVPNKVENFIRKGLLFRYMGKTKESEDLFARAIAIDPNNPDAYYQVGRSAMESQNWDEAIKNLVKATQLKKDNDQWFYWLGVVHMYKRDYPQAQKAFATAGALKADEKNTWFNLGQAYYFEGSDVKKAIEPLEKVIALDNTDVEALSLLGSVAMHASVVDYDKAIVAYTRALEIKPESQEYKNYLEYAKKQKEASQAPAKPKKKRR